MGCDFLITTEVEMNEERQGPKVSQRSHTGSLRDP